MIQTFSLENVNHHSFIIKYLYVKCAEQKTPMISPQEFFGRGWIESSNDKLSRKAIKSELPIRQRGTENLLRKVKIFATQTPVILLSKFNLLRVPNIFTYSEYTCHLNNYTKVCVSGRTQIMGPTKRATSQLLLGESCSLTFCHHDSANQR